MMKTVNPRSPVPLYHQIAEAIREQIEAGELAPGDALEPLREAARTWGVNLHTVRHAYTALARKGLVESRGARGTRVSTSTPSSRLPQTEDRGRFVGRVVREAFDRHGLAPSALAKEISRHPVPAAQDRPVVHVVECSAWQCKSHVREIEARFDVDAREWSLERGEEPPPGDIIATYFHYNDIRRRWPHRLSEVRFVTIVPDPGIASRLPKNTLRVLVCERDEATAENVAADITTLLEPVGCAVEPVVSAEPELLIAETGDDSIVLIAPRVWASLDEPARMDHRVLEADYVIESGELNAIGVELGWVPVIAGTNA
jgi:GntR family transcriptional regulator